MSNPRDSEPRDKTLHERFAALQVERPTMPRGARVLAAVSGGLDSMVLFDLLRRAAPSFGWTLAAGHVDHGLRDDSGRDLALVRNAAAAAGIPFFFRRVGHVIEEDHGSLEARARRARLRALEEVRVEAKADLVALAHTAEDRAETVLMNLLRGTGPRGLGSLREKRGRIVRPLLSFRREELLRHAKREGLSWRTDATNWTGDFSRNWIRHHLIPLLERRVNPRVVESLARAGDHMARWSASVDERVAETLARASREEESGMTLEGLNGHHDEWTLSQVLAEAHRRVSSEGAELSERHLRAVMELLRGRERRQAHLPGSVVAEGSRGRVRFSPAGGGEPRPEPPAPIEVAPGGRAVCGVTALDVQEIDGPTAARKARRRRDAGRRDREIFDAEDVHPPITVRPWRSGDRIRPWGLGGTKLVSDLLTDEGIVGEARGNVLVMEDAEGLLWVIGVRRSDRAPVGEDTARALECSVTPCVTRNAVGAASETPAPDPEPPQQLEETP